MALENVHPIEASSRSSWLNSMQAGGACQVTAGASTGQRNQSFLSLLGLVKRSGNTHPCTGQRRFEGTNKKNIIIETKNKNLKKQ